MRKVLNELNSQLVVDYVAKNYDIKDYLYDNNLITDIPREEFTGGLISSPFAPDSTPSFSVDLKNQRFKSFSGPHQGNYISLVTYNKQLLEGIKTNYFNELENIVINDDKLRSELLINSIYDSIDDLQDIIDGNFNFTKKVTQSNKRITSFMELSNIMRNKKESIETIKLAMERLYSGDSPNDIYNMLYTNETTNRDDSDLNDDIVSLFNDLGFL